MDRDRFSESEKKSKSLERIERRLRYGNRTFTNLQRTETHDAIFDNCNNMYEVLLFAIVKQACNDYIGKNPQQRASAELFFRDNPYELEEGYLQYIVKRLDEIREERENGEKFKISQKSITK